MIVVAGFAVASPESFDEMRRISLEHGVYIDAENPLKLHFFERWADAAAIKAHFAVPQSRAFAKQLRALAADAGAMHVLEAAPARL